MSGERFTTEDVEHLLIAHATNLWPNDWRSSLADVDLQGETVIDLRKAGSQPEDIPEREPPNGSRVGWLLAVATFLIALLVVSIDTAANQIEDTAASPSRGEPVLVRIIEGPWITDWSPNNFEMYIVTNEACSSLNWTIENLETGQTVMSESDGVRCSDGQRAVGEMRSEPVFESGSLYQIVASLEGVDGNGTQGLGTAEQKATVTYSDVHFRSDDLTEAGSDNG